MTGIRVTGRMLDMAYLRWHVLTGCAPYQADRAGFMRFLGGDPLPLMIGQQITGGEWDLSEEGGRKVLELNSPHWMTLLRMHIIRK